MNIALAALSLFEFAPVIGQWFGGGRSESIANRVLNIAKEIAGQDNIKDVVDSFKHDPNQVMQFQQALQSMETEVELALLQDRQEARKRDFQIQSNGYTNKRADIMVFSAVIGLGFCLGSLGFYGRSLPGEAVGIISTIAGIFGACLKDAYSFEFGSSRSSKQKDQTMAAMIDQL